MAINTLAATNAVATAFIRARSADFSSARGAITSSGAAGLEPLAEGAQSISRLVDKCPKQRRCFVRHRYDEQMSAVHDLEPRLRNHACENAAVDERHDRVVMSHDDQRWLFEPAQPQNARPSRDREQLTLETAVWFWREGE